MKKHTVLFATVMANRHEGRAREERHRAVLISGKRKREDVGLSGYCEDCCGGDIGSSLGAVLREYCPTVSCSESFTPATKGALVVGSAQDLAMDSQGSSTSSPATSKPENQRTNPGLPSRGNYLGRAQSSSKIAALNNVETSPQGHRKSVLLLHYVM